MIDSYEMTGSDCSLLPRYYNICYKTISQLPLRLEFGENHQHICSEIVQKKNRVWYLLRFALCVVRLFIRLFVLHKWPNPGFRFSFGNSVVAPWRYGYNPNNNGTGSSSKFMEKGLTSVQNWFHNLNISINTPFKANS